MPKDLNTQKHTQGCYTQRTSQTGDEDKMPGRWGESRWTGIAWIVHLLAMLDFTLVNSANSSSPYGLFRPNARRAAKGKAGLSARLSNTGSLLLRRITSLVCPPMPHGASPPLLHMGKTHSAGACGKLASPPSPCSIPCLHVHTDIPPQRLYHTRHQPHLTSF